MKILDNYSECKKPYLHYFGNQTYLNRESLKDICRTEDMIDFVVSLNNRYEGKCKLNNSMGLSIQFPKDIELSDILTVKNDELNIYKEFYFKA